MNKRKKFFAYILTICMIVSIFGTNGIAIAEESGFTENNFSITEEISAENYTEDATEIENENVESFEDISEEIILEETEITETETQEEKQEETETEDSSEQETSIVQETLNDETEKTEEQVAFNSSVSIDGVTVKVEAPKGVFPKDSTLHVKKLQEEQYEGAAADAAVEEMRDENRNVLDTLIFDITITDKDGKEIQPDTSFGEVKVSFTLDEKINDEYSVDVYHVSEETFDAEKLDITETTDPSNGGNTMVIANTDSFSLFVVDITANSKIASVNCNVDDYFTISYLIQLYFNKTVDPIYATSSDPKAIKINDDVSRFIVQGKSSGPVTLKVKDIEGDEYIFEFTISDSQLTDVPVLVFWDDNHDDYPAYNIKARPYKYADASDMSSLFDLYFTPEGGTETKLTNDNLSTLGLTSKPVLQYINTGNLDIYMFQYSSLPKRIENPTATGGASVSVTYSVKPNVASFEGYDAPVITTDEEGIKVTYVAQINWSANVVWKDADNIYDTRPETFSANTLTVTRKTVGGEAETVFPYELKLEQSGTGYVLEICGASGYRDGKPLVYSITDSGISAGDAGNYAAVYKNVDTYADNEDALFNGGTLQRTLTKDTTFVLNKEWIDGNTAQEYRPNFNLYLYRIAEIYEGEGENKSLVIDVNNNIEPVPNFDFISVPKEDKSNYTYEGKSGNATLPMYDSEGRRYIYFALEQGLTDYYVCDVNNTNALVSEEVINKFNSNTDEFKRNGYVKYLLNGGTIKNKLEYTGKIPVSKTFTAASMQNMLGSAEVILQLQKWDNNQNEWVNAKSSDIEEVVTEQFGGTVNQTENEITITLSGFNAENLTKSDSSVVARLYDAEGKRLYYRWIEKEISFDKGTSEETSASPAYGTTWDDTGNYKGGSNNLGQKGPTTIVSGKEENSTIFFESSIEVDYASNSTKAINLLESEKRIKISKTWNTNGHESEISQDAYIATFVLRRSDGKTSSVDLYDRKGLLVENIVIEGSEDQEKYWRNLDRYDENGAEYTYEVTEETSSEWYPAFTTSQKLVDDDNGNKVEQIDASYTNSYGEGEGFTFDLLKVWNDGSDLATRHPVKVQIIKFRNLDSEENPVKAEVILSTENDWSAIVTISSAGEGDKPSNYVVIEKTVDDAVVDYGTKTYQDIYDNSVNTPEIAIGSLEKKGPSDSWRLAYSYDVYINNKSPNKDAGRQKYEIKNVRTGEIEERLEKTWKAGGETPAAGFTLKRNDEVLGKFVIDFDEGEGVKTPKLTVTESTSDFPEFSIVSYDLVNSVVTINFKNSSAPEGTGLPKYDSKGNPYTYTFIETTIGGETIVKGKADVNGDIYSTSLSGNILKPHQGSHHSGEVYLWSATNSRSQIASLDAYGIWWDDGEECIPERPSARFNVYRVSVAENTNLLDMIRDIQTNQPYAEKPGTVEPDERETLAAALKAYADADHILYQDRFWNTEINPWLWKCDLGNVDMYDEDGNYYIYFLAATPFNGTTDYITNYYEYTLDPNESPTASGPETILNGITKNDLQKTDGNVLILSDGVNDYSRSVVNRREKTRTLSMRKLWRVQDFWKNLTVFPSVYVELYQLTSAQRKEAKAQGYINADDKYDYLLKDEFIASKGLTPIANESVTLSSSTGYDYKFGYHKNVETGEYEETLDKYDDYGRKYYYYTFEDNSKLSSADKLALSSYLKEDVEYEGKDASITNVYKIKEPFVKITFTKKWAISTEYLNRYDVKDLAPVTFKLYAQPVKKEGENEVNDGDPVLMSQKTLSPSDLGVGESATECTFTEFSEYAKAPNTKLPYYGPSGLPLKYYITESTTNGYTQEIELNNLSKATYDPDTNYYITLTDYDPDQQLYTGKYSTTFTNTYTGKDNSDHFKTYEFYKTWNDSDGYTDNSSLRPNLTFTIYRKYRNITAGSEDYVIEPYYYYDGTTTKTTINTADSPVEGVWDFDKSSSTNKWKGTIYNLQKYAPNGEEYIYYIQKEVGANGDSYERGGTVNTITSTDSNYSYLASANGDSEFVNKLDISKTIIVKKKWMKNGTDELSYEDFVNRRDAGGLPQSIAFVLQKSTDGENWSYVSPKPSEDPGSTESNEESVTFYDGSSEITAVGKAFALSGISRGQYYTWREAYAVEFTELLCTNIDYRVVEVMIWDDGATKTAIVKEDGDDGKVTSYGVEGKKEKSTDGDNEVFSFTNTVPQRYVTVLKKWRDANNRDHLRNVEIRLYQKKAGQTYEDGVLYQKITVDDRYTTPTIDRYTTPTITAKDARDQDLPEDFYEVTLNGNDISWSISFNYLPEYVNGESVEYFPREVYPITSEKASDLVAKEYTNTHNTSTFSIKASKNWNDGNNKYGLRPTSINLTLQWTTDEENERTESSWSSVFEDVPNSITYDNGRIVFTKSDVTQEIHYDQDTQKWTEAIWEKLPTRVLVYNKSLNLAESKKIYYRAYDQVNGYTYSATPISADPDNVSTNSEKPTVKEETVTNELDGKTLNAKKYWTDTNDTEPETLNKEKVWALVDAGVLPGTLTFTVWYTTNGTDYLPLKVLNEDNGEYNSLLITKNTKDLIGNSGSVTFTVAEGLPQYDALGNKIEYQVREIQPDIAYITKEDSADIDILDNKTADITNKYDFTFRTVTKTWNDEGNRDGERNVTFTLKRDGADFIKITASDNNGTLVKEAKYYSTTATTEDKWVALPESMFNVVKNDTSNTWTFTWKYLPVKKADNSADSVYTVFESTANTIVSSLSSTGATVPAGSDGLSVQNTYQPQRGTVKAEKVWDDNDNKYGQRPTEVKFKLQWAINPNNNSWQDVAKNSLTTTGTKTLYPDGDVYTTSDVEQTLKADTDPEKNWKAIWENLPIYYNKNKIYYRVIETAGSDGYTVWYKKNSGEYSTVIENSRISIDLPTQFYLKNSGTSINVAKKWFKGVTEETGDAYKAHADSVKVKLQVKKDGQWTDLYTPGTTPVLVTADLLAANNYQYTFTGVQSGKDYKVTELSISFGGVDIDINDAGTTIGNYKVSYSSDNKTVKNTLDGNSLTVSKIWADEENRDRLRPDSIFVKVYRDKPADADMPAGKTAEDYLIGTLELKAANNWNATMTDLPKYQNGYADDSHLSVYTIVEQSFTNDDKYSTGFAIKVGTADSTYDTGKTASTKITADTKVDFTNTYDPAKGAVTVSKTWDDFDNYYGSRPVGDDALTFTLKYSVDGGATWQTPTKQDLSNEVYSDGGVHSTDLIVQKAKVNADGSISAIKWNNLPLTYNNGTNKVDVYYKVEETAVNGYDTSYDKLQTRPESDGSSSNIKVTNTLKRTSMNIEKQWFDDEGKQSRPDEVVLTLIYVHGGITGYRDVTLKADENWTTSFKCPLTDSAGNNYTYALAEKSMTYYVPGGANISVTGSGNYNFSFEKTEATGSITLTASNTLKGKSLSLEKVWNDGNDRDKLRPESIVVKVYRDKPAEGEIPEGKTAEDYLIETLTLNAANNWKATITKLPKYQNGYADDSHLSKYTVVEQTFSNDGKYSTDIVLKVSGAADVKTAGKTAVTTATADTTAAITNKHVPQTFTAHGIKNWVDNDDRYGSRNKSIKLILQWTTTPDVEGSWKYVENKGSIDPATDDGTKVYTSSDITQTLTVDEVSKKWPEAVWEGLSAYVLEGTTKKTVYYRAYENVADIPGYIIDSSTDVHYDPTGTKTYEESVITNALITGRNMTVVKNWVDENGEDLKAKLQKYGVLPDSITVTLQSREKPDGTWNDVPSSYGTRTLSEANNWSDVFEEINTDAFEYRVVEKAITYGGVSVPVTYGTDATSGTLPNYIYSMVTGPDGEKNLKSLISNKADMSELTIEKVWEDGNDRDRLRPESIVVKVYRDKPADADMPEGKTAEDYLIETLTLKAANNWKATITDLPKYKNGYADYTPSEYTIEEQTFDNDEEYSTSFSIKVGTADPVKTDGMTAVTTATADTTAVITNKHVPQTIELEGIKNWDDGDNCYGFRPESVKLSLQWTTTPDVEDSWEYVENKGSINPATDDGTKVYSISDLTQTLEYNKDTGSWNSAVWKELPVYVLDKEGVKQQEVSYRPYEKNVDIPSGYYIKSVDVVKAATGNSVITNALKPGTKISVEKDWDGKEELLKQYGMLPDGVIVALQYKSKLITDAAWWTVTTAAGQAILNEGNDWKHVFENINTDIYEYRIIETGIKYGEETVPVTYDADKDSGSIVNFIYSSLTQEIESNTVYKTTIKNVSNQTEFTVKKTWVDEENRDQGRTDEVYVQLYRDGTEVGEPVQLSKDGTPAYSYFWKDLPIYKNNSTKDKSVYTVKEYTKAKDKGGKAIDAGGIFTGNKEVKYTVTYSDAATLEKGTEETYTGNAIITNTHDPEKGSVAVSKKWDDLENRYNTRPVGEKKLTFTLKYSVDDGKTWAEVEQKDLSGEVYSDGGIYSKQAPVQQANVDKDGKISKIEWDDLPLTYFDGTDVVKVLYKVEEAKVDSYKTTYDKESTKPKADGDVAEIEVTNELELSPMTIEKQWKNDDKYKDLVRPDEIVLTLHYTHGKESGDYEVTLKAKEEWKAKLNCPVIDSEGNKYEYSLTEKSMTYVDSKGEKRVVAGSGEYDFDAKIVFEDSSFVATAVNTLQSASLIVNDYWYDGNNREALRPQSVVLQLERDGKSYGDKVVIRQKDYLGENNNVWTYTWTDLPIYKEDAAGRTQNDKSVYRVRQVTDVKDLLYDTDDTEETTLPVKVVKLAKASKVEGVVNITNIHQMRTVKINGSKVWDDKENPYGTRPEDVKIRVEYSLDGGKTWKSDLSVKEVSERPDPKDDKGAIVYSASEIKQTITGKPDEDKWDGGKWLELSAYALADPTDFTSGTKVIYRLSEEEKDVPKSYVQTESKETSFDSTKEEPAELEVLNTLKKQTSVKVKKVFDFGIEKDDFGIIPDSIKVHLQYQPAEGEEWKDVPNNFEFELNAENDWETEVTEGLPDANTYRFIEKSITYGKKVIEAEAIDGEKGTQTGTVGSFEYSSEQTSSKGEDGALEITSILTNKIPETKLSVEKIWDDSNDKDKIRPSSITIQLVRDGKDIGKPVTIKSSDDWKYEWSYLPVYKNGSGTEKSEYKIVETAVEGYETAYDKKSISFDGLEDQKVTLSITNKHIPKDDPSGVKTGDSSNVGLYAAMFLAALAAGISGIIGLRRKKRQ